MHSLEKLNTKINDAMRTDRHRLRRRLRSMRQARDKGKPFDRSLDRLVRELDRSVDLRRRRQAGLPNVVVDPSLPIAEKADDIAAAIRDHAVTIVCGETGSGKSTQLPKICLQLGRGIDGIIGHTQPRRIAARSVAARLAGELHSTLGQHVGFKVRFTDATRPETYVKLMTDGILLAETQGDRFLDQYDTVIIDEAHERSLNIDFLLGYVKRLLSKRRDLKLIVTSATIDAERFSRHFASPATDQPAPVIEVTGRTFPVEMRYRPLDSDDEDSEELDQQKAIAQTIDELARIDRGDMLVFLPTERDILETAKTLRGRRIPGDMERTEILPLYARLSPKDQNKVFKPGAHRRIVLATNVAESSLTVPRIRYVIDTGTARISRYSPRRKVQRLPIEAISRASAEQRAGRCGRIAPGICVRLYSEDDYLGRERFTSPEIRRTNLASVILQTKALRLGAIEEFPFLDPPRAEAIRDGYKTLFELGAIDEKRELTDLGRRLARLPVDPRIGRMILAAADERCMSQVLIIAAALEVQDPRLRPTDKQQAADECHAQFADDSSDFLGYLNLWDFFHQLRAKLSRNQLRKACRQNFLSYNRMREWLDIHRQLRQLADESGLGQPTATESDRYDAVHRALLTGLLANVAFCERGYEYTGAGGSRYYLWPGSGIFETKPKWIMAAELVETTRLYARTVARVNPEWIEPIAGHLVKRSYSEPHWSRRAASAMAYEKVSLFGLAVVQRRRVRLGPIDPETSRELFIRHGLVDGQYQTRASFLQHNRNLVAELESLATKSRRSDLFAGEQRQFDFYNSRIPEDVYDGNRLKRWLRKAERRDPEVLRMTQADLFEEEPDEIMAAEFPDELTVQETRLTLEYRFEPGAESDGITLRVPKMALGQLHPERLGWLVPGLLEQKIVALIRSLPKSLRRNFVPAPDTARKALREIRFGEGPFLGAVADALRKVCGERVSPDDFQLEKLPPHLHMNVHVIDDDGGVASSGRDLHYLQRELAAEASASFAELDHSDWTRDGIMSWDFGDLPEQVRFESGGLTLNGHPMLADQGEDVSLRLTDSAETAAQQTRTGLRRLFCIAENRELRAQVTWIPKLDQMKLRAATFCGAKQLEQQLAELIADRAFLDQDQLARDADQYNRMLFRGRKRIALAVQEVAKLAIALLEAYHQTQVVLEEATSPRWKHAVEDVASQMEHLTPEGFLTRTPWAWLRHYPRYFQAMKIRLDKLAGAGIERDRQHYNQIEPFWQAYLQRAAAHQERGVCDAELDHFRWMVEEFRVSLFAQQLGTSMSVSAKRLEKQWATVQT